MKQEEPMMPQEPEMMEGMTSFNAGYNQGSALQLRLNPDKILRDIELHLRGSKTIHNFTEDGEHSLKRHIFGKPKANKEGMNGIMYFLHTIINTMTVQGNYDEERYNNFIADARTDLTYHMILNQHHWELNESEIGLIVDSIMNIVEPFMSRTIGNKERDSYSSTVRTVESSQMGRQGNQGNGGLLNNLNPFNK